MIHVSSIASPPCYALDELYVVAQGGWRGEKKERKKEPADDVIINDDH